MVDLSNLHLIKKILSGVILLKVILGVTFTQPIYMYVCVYVYILVSEYAFTRVLKGSEVLLYFWVNVNNLHLL